MNIYDSIITKVMEDFDVENVDWGKQVIDVSVDERRVISVKIPLKKIKHLLSAAWSLRNKTLIMLFIGSDDWKIPGEKLNVSFPEGWDYLIQKGKFSVILEKLGDQSEKNIWKSPTSFSFWRILAIKLVGELMDAGFSTKEVVIALSSLNSIGFNILGKLGKPIKTCIPGSVM